MRIKTGNPLDLIVGATETVTISIVRSTGLAETVNYSLNGTASPGSRPKNQPCVFPVSTNSDLAMTVHYAANQGGSFTTRATGSLGGDVSEVSETQAPGEAFRLMGYRFTIQ
jgi:hypothetical protein